MTGQWWCPMYVGYEQNGSMLIRWCIHMHLGKSFNGSYCSAWPYLAQQCCLLSHAEPIWWFWLAFHALQLGATIVGVKLSGANWHSLFSWGPTLSFGQGKLRLRNLPLFCLPKHSKKHGLIQCQIPFLTHASEDCTPRSASWSVTNC